MTAAVTDPYADVNEYKQRVGKTSGDDDLALLDQLKAISRFIDIRLDRFFTQDAAVVVRTFDGNGNTRLWLPDIASTTGLVVKVDLNADYDFTDSNETLTINTHFWVGPHNADKGPEVWPWEYLEIVPNNSVLSIWPSQVRAVQVTAKFGWPAVPNAIKELTIGIVRYLRDLEQAGGTLALQNIEGVIQLSSRLNLLWWDIQRQYAKVPSL
jgi:hypothetical protein